MSQEPNRSLSHKLRQLGRLNLKPRNGGADDKEHSNKPSPAQTSSNTDFRIVHTPDRLVSPRPIPSVEECREEIKRWHREAAEMVAVDDDGGEDDDDNVEFSLTPTVSRETGTRESRRLAGEWAIQSTRRVASPEAAGAGNGEGWDGEMERVLGTLGLGGEGGGDEGRGEGGEKGPASTGGRNKMNELNYGPFPIFQPLPGQIPRDIDLAVNKKMKPPPLQTHNKPPVGGFLSPEDTEKAYTRLRKSLDKRKSPLVNEYTFSSSSSSSSSSSDTPTAIQPPPPHAFNQTIYARGLCPSCLHPRSKIEALRCGRCHAHLSTYLRNTTSGSDPAVPKRRNGKYNGKATPETARTRPNRPISPLSTTPPLAAPAAKSPPPLRERAILSQGRSASASQSRERHGHGHGHEKGDGRNAAQSPAPASAPKRRSASLRNLAVSPARDYTYLPLVESERRPLVAREVRRGGGQGKGLQSRSRSRGRRREGVGLGLGLTRGEEDPWYVAEGQDAELLVSIYEEYGGGEGDGEGRSRYTFGGYV